MEVLVDLNKCSRNNISPDEYVLLYLTYFKRLKKIEALFGRDKAFDIRNRLCDTKFVLSDKNVKFKDTILSKKNVEIFFKIKNQKINFWEWYNCYPIRIGSRVLRAANPDSKAAKEHEKKYLLAIQDEASHKLAIKATEAFIQQQRVVGKLNFLPNILTVLNQRSWESWEVFITAEKEDNWHQDEI